MDLDLSEEQTMLSDMVRRLCEDTVPLTELRALEGREPGYSDIFWSRLADLGVTGLWVDEAFGGLGLGALEAAVVHEQLGRSLAVSPHVASSIQSTRLLALAADASQCEYWLPAMAEGSALVTVAALEPNGGFGAEGVQLRAQRVDGGYRLSGSKHFVPFASVAAGMIVLARSGDDPGEIIGLLVKPGVEGLSHRLQANLAGEPYYSVVFEDVWVEAADALNQGQLLWNAWQQTMFASLVPLAARAVGAAARVHEISVAYAREREAFGRPIGGFQSIAHYLADAIVQIEGCRTLVHQAAWAHDNGKPYQRLAAMAKLQACDVFRRVSALAIQVHGGLGYTLEATPQLYYRRAKQWQLLDWDNDRLESEIAELTLQEYRLAEKRVGDV